MIIYINEQLNQNYKKINKSSVFPMTLTVVKNTEKAPRTELYNQEFEPAGNYVIQKYASHLDHLDNYKSFEVEISNPLLINVEDSVIAWKKKLADEYKATGKKISSLLKKEGYDAIITYYDNADTGEIILL